MNNDSAARPKITSFHNYRTYLKRAFEWNKQTRRGFSYEFCARKLGRSKSYLKQVIDEKVHIDLNNVAKVAKLFGMTEFEKQYFVVLVLVNQLREPSLKAQFSAILDRLRMNEEIEGLKKYRAKINTQGSQLRDWLSQAIGAMTRMPDFSVDSRWIQKTLSNAVPLSEIQSTIDAMLKSKMIDSKNGKFFETSDHHSPDAFEPESHKRYLHGALKAADVLNGSLENNRPALFFNGALAIEANQFQQVADAFYRFIDHLIATSGKSSNPDRVIYVSNNLFHVVNGGSQAATER